MDSSGPLSRCSTKWLGCCRLNERRSDQSWMSLARASSAGSLRSLVPGGGGVRGVIVLKGVGCLGLLLYFKLLAPPYQPTHHPTDTQPPRPRVPAPTIGLHKQQRVAPHPRPNIRAPLHRHQQLPIQKLRRVARREAGQLHAVVGPSAGGQLNARLRVQREGL